MSNSTCFKYIINAYCLSDKGWYSAHEPCYLSILYVQATYMSRRSETYGDKYKQELYPFSLTGDKGLQEVIL